MQRRQSWLGLMGLALGGLVILPQTHLSNPWRMGVALGLALLGIASGLALYRTASGQEADGFQAPQEAALPESEPAPTPSATPSEPPRTHRARRMPLGPRPQGRPQSEAEAIARLTQAQKALDQQRQACERERLNLRQQEILERNLIARLRGTLALIAGYAEMLNSGDLGEIIEAQRYPLLIIHRRARQLNATIEDLEALLQTSRLDLPKGYVDLTEVLREALSPFEARCREARLTLTQTLTAGTPLVHGHKDHLRRVLENLLDNAVKFTPEGGTVNVTLTHDKNDVIFKVSDTGIGIAEEDQAHIFERFYQASTASGRPTGSGLGLALVKEVVQAHGGSVHVESQVRRGTTFTIRIPAVQPELENA